MNARARHTHATPLRWAVAFSLAAAEFRASLKGFARGFRLFMACLAIGVAAAAAAGSAAEAFRQGLAERARAITGGDVRVDLNERYLPVDAEAWLKARGTLSRVTEARGMAALVARPGGAATGESSSPRKLVGLKGVDSLFPLEGAVEFRTDGSTRQTGDFRALIASTADGAYGALVEKGFLEAFHARIGDRFRVGAGEFVIRGEILREPESVGNGFSFTPDAIVSAQALADAGLGRPGGLFSASWRLALPAGVDPAAFVREWNRTFPALAERMSSRANAAPGLADFIGRLEIFLTFVALSALLAGGLGVEGAVRAFLEARRPQIATLKTLGASAAEIRAAYGLEIAGLALIGAGLGALLGIATPSLLGWLAGDALPLPDGFRLYPKPVAGAVLMGLFAALAFSAGAVGAARATPPLALYRGGTGGRVPWPERVASLLGFVGLAVVAAGFSSEPVFALVIYGGGLLVFALLAGLGYALKWIARLLARRFDGAFGQALGNLGGPGSLAPQMAPAIGFGVLLLAALTQIQSNLTAQIAETAPRNLPSLLFTEIPFAEGARFDAVVKAAAGTLAPEKYQRAPVLTARVVSLNGRELRREDVIPAERWFINNDITVSWSAAPPPENVTIAGKWWRGSPAMPEISVETDAATGIGAKLGDVIGFDVLGRPVEARLVHTRKVDWGGWGANFAVIFSPGLLEGANPRMAAIARLSKAEDDRAAKAVGDAFPNVGIVRIRDALAAAAELLGKLSAAIRATAGVALLAGALAVTGALAAGLRRRLYDAAILKALGASRARILWGFALETALAGLAAAAIGAALGFATAYPIVVRAFEAKWVPDFVDVGIVGAVAFVGLALAGLVMGLRALQSAPHRLLAAELADLR